jgi:type 2 lantibiotic biosynthesis protein LanM
MRANAQLSLLAERLFPGSSYEALLRSASVERNAADAVQRVRLECELDREPLSEEAWLAMRRSLAETLAWMQLFAVPEDRIRTVIDEWVQAQCEMLRRLAADRAAIEVHFGCGAGQVVALDLDLSDRHRGGRTVAAFTFDSGLKLIYKPRDIGIEAWFTGFQTCLNELGAPLPFLALQALTREGYGWTEFAVHTRCRDDDQLRCFYRNAGALLCLLHLLRCTDGHYENLIACGEHPVFVDAETLFEPSLSDSGNVVSVLRTGMIPRINPLQPSAASNLGALSCVSPQSVAVPIPKLNGRAGYLESALLTPETNVPFPPGLEATPEAYAEEIIEGFCRTWQFAAAHRSAILETMDGGQSRLTRYVFRDTLAYYQSIVAALCAGDLDGLMLPPLAQTKTVFAPLEEAERLALRRLDIPRFTLAASQTSLHGVEGCFARSGFERAREAMGKLTDQEMEKQAAVIRVSWGLYGAAKTLA